jgi:hypothetical protein
MHSNTHRESILQRSFNGVDMGYVDPRRHVLRGHNKFIKISVCKGPSVIH